MATYQGHEVEIVEQHGQACRIVAKDDDVTINQEGEEEGGWVFADEIEAEA